MSKPAVPGKRVGSLWKCQLCLLLYYTDRIDLSVTIIPILIFDYCLWKRCSGCVQLSFSDFFICGLCLFFFKLLSLSCCSSSASLKFSSQLLLYLWWAFQLVSCLVFFLLLFVLQYMWLCFCWGCLLPHSFLVFHYVTMWWNTKINQAPDTYNCLSTESSCPGGIWCGCIMCM